MLAHVLLGDLAEDPCARCGELDRDLPVPRRVRVGLHLRARQLRAGEERVLLDHVRDLPLRLRLLVHPPLVQDRVRVRQIALERVLDRHALVEQLEFQERGLADERLRPRRVLDARQLDQDPLAPLPRDRGLRDAELVDAIADRLQPLADRVVAQPVDHTLAHHELEAPRGLVLVAPLEVLQLGRRGQGVVPALRARQLDDHRRVALAREALDRDALALERGLEILGGTVGLARDVLVGLDAEHEVDAALQVEAEVDRPRRRVEVPAGHDDHDGDEDRPRREVPRHSCRLAARECARWRCGRTRAAPGPRRAARPCARRAP